MEPEQEIFPAGRRHHQEGSKTRTRARDSSVEIQRGGRRVPEGCVVQTTEQDRSGRDEYPAGSRRGQD